MRYDKLPLLDQNSTPSFGSVAAKRYLPVVVLAVLSVTLYLVYTGVPEGRFHGVWKQKVVNEVWDTMDGQGDQFKEEVNQDLDPRYHQLNLLPSCGDLASTDVQQDVTNLVQSVKKQFSDCITPIVNQWKGRAKEKEENILVTLGVGHDTTAEELLNRTIPNTKFYGADPIIEPNRQMYSAFGKFFPFAIGKEPGFTKFRVLPNQNQKTRRYVYQDKIDFAWIDIEGGEFEFLDLIHHEVQFCQFNIEIHSRFAPAGVQVFHDFIFKVLEEQKYVFLQSMNTDAGVHRMFFVNVEDKECLAKYYNDYSGF
uniref:Methyltransf_21 domain-containing protein n=1 Tax=Caenorhabditis tropicalis TaxID=1561998 RepID=A0A1I7UXF1_9PELO